MKLFLNRIHQNFRWDPEDLHSDWASTGINRAVIDEEVSQKTETSLSIVKSLILPAKVDTRFKYLTQVDLVISLISLCELQ